MTRCRLCLGRVYLGSAKLGEPAQPQPAAADILTHVLSLGGVAVWLIVVLAHSHSIACCLTCGLLAAAGFTGIHHWPVLLQLAASISISQIQSQTPMHLRCSQQSCPEVCSCTPLITWSTLRETCPRQKTPLQGGFRSSLAGRQAVCTTTDSFVLPSFLSEGHLDTNTVSTRVDLEPSAVAPACQGSKPSICPCMRARLCMQQPCKKTLMSCSSVMQGVAGKPVPAAAMADALQARDMFLYFGHGSADQYLPVSQLRRLPRCAAGLLMGCSSGRIRGKGSFEATGAILAYLLAGQHPSLRLLICCGASSLLLLIWQPVVDALPAWSPAMSLCWPHSMCVLQAALQRWPTSGT